MNQLELATLLNIDDNLVVDQNAVSRIEKGNRFVKDYEIIALAKALNKHPMWLLFGDQIPKNSNDLALEICKSVARLS